MLSVFQPAMRLPVSLLLVSVLTSLWSARAIADAPDESVTITVSSETLPAIPETVTSFGAAATDDAVYIYGGHTGPAHEYYAEAQARTLWRLDLKQPKQWESLGEGPGLQGLAMVAHRGKVYRVGGFTAKNRDGMPADLWSQASVARFDPDTKQWEDLPSLPEPRSSFDAAVCGDRIYVVGGWSLRGDAESEWLSSLVMLDLTQRPLRWQKVSEAPFQRRAMSVAAFNDRIYAIGGMQQAGGPTTRVDIFDTATGQWSRGPDLVGEAMDGFGSASFAVGQRLYSSTYSGKLQRLTEDGKSWEVVSDLANDRFFHRLLPISSNQLIAVGGASMSSGKFEDVDLIRIR